MRLIDLEDFTKRTSSENNVKFRYIVIQICSTNNVQPFQDRCSVSLGYCYVCPGRSGQVSEHFPRDLRTCWPTVGINTILDFHLF
jgi:hypothetical protein